MGAPLTLALSAGGSIAPALSEPWTEPEDLAGCVVGDEVDLSSVCAVASEILFALSGRQYGVRTETVRPYAGDRRCGWQMYGIATRQWDRLGHDVEPMFLSLKAPVRDILEVKIDGGVVPTSGYRLYDDHRLLRVDPSTGGEGYWPLHQDLAKADTAAGTFSITYQWGKDVTLGGRAAARHFACQLAKYFNNDSDCQLSDRVVNVTRQGVTQILLDPAQFLAQARTGLYLCDAWLSAVNPNGRRRKPTVFNPDHIAPLRDTSGT